MNFIHGKMGGLQPTLYRSRNNPIRAACIKLLEFMT
jgi:hypothetical protein